MKLHKQVGTNRFPMVLTGNFFTQGVADNIAVMTSHTYIKAEFNGSLTEIFINDMERLDLLNQNHQIIYYNNVFHFHDWIHNLTINVDNENKYISLNNNYYTSDKESIEFFNVSNLSTEDLVINVKKCVIVWSVLGINSSILQSNYDGSDQTVLYSRSRQTQHLTIDYYSDRYYFVDITDFSLYSIDFDGSNELFLMKSYSLFNAINGLRFVSNRLYISNQYLVYKVPYIDTNIPIAEVLFQTKSWNKLNQILDSEFFTINATIIQRQEFTSVFVFDVLPEFENRCENSKCSHICIPIGQSHRCVCPDLFSLLNETHCQLIDYQEKVEVMTKKKTDQSTIPFSLDSKREHVILTNKTNVFGIINLILILIIISILCMMIYFMFM